MGRTKSRVFGERRSQPGSRGRDSRRPLGERHESFGELVVYFQDMAFGCAYAVLGDFYLAEDAAQEAFITAWQSLRQLALPNGIF